MKRSLNVREKRLLFLCLGTIFLVGNGLALREFTAKRKGILGSLEQLAEQATVNQALLSDRAFHEKHRAWLDQHMPYTESAGRAQGQLLEYLQNAALDNELTISNQTLLEPLELDHFNEVAVSIRIRGDQEKMLRWLLSLQSPERFQAIKSIDLELDSRAREKTPQAQCNLTVARWFNSEPPPQAAVPASLPASIPAPATQPELEREREPEADPVNPLEISSPLDSLSTERSAS